MWLKWGAGHALEHSVPMRQILLKIAGRER
jgi:hypothetical protein